MYSADTIKEIAKAYVEAFSAFCEESKQIPVAGVTAFFIGGIMDGIEKARKERKWTREEALRLVDSLAGKYKVAKKE